jgi:hypothetical protein
MKMQNSGEPRGSPRIMIRYIINKNALSKDFTPFCDENCKKEKILVEILEILHFR